VPKTTDERLPFLPKIAPVELPAARLFPASGIQISLRGTFEAIVEVTNITIESVEIVFDHTRPDLMPKLTFTEPA
jgi:hypothetical protein